MRKLLETPVSSRSLQDNLELITKTCSDAQGKEIVVLDVAKSFSLCNYFVIASARSDRQVQGITNRIINTLAQLGVKPMGSEGLNEGQWALIDYGDIVVHIFFEKTREYYDLEGLWTRAKRLAVSEDGTIEWSKLAA